MVDLQKAFPPPPALVARVRRYSRRFRRRIFTRFVNRIGTLFRMKRKQRCCAPGSSDGEFLIAPGKMNWCYQNKSTGSRRPPSEKSVRVA